MSFLGNPNPNPNILSTHTHTRSTVKGGTVKTSECKECECKEPNPKHTHPRSLTNAHTLTHSLTHSLRLPCHRKPACSCGGSGSKERSCPLQWVSPRRRDQSRCPPLRSYWTVCWVSRRPWHPMDDGLREVGAHIHTRARTHAHTHTSIQTQQVLQGLTPERKQGLDRSC